MNLNLFQAESTGFTPNAPKYSGHFKEWNYQDDMNHINYKRWLQEKLIHNLESSSVIVVDNASYHNERINRHVTSKPEKLKCCPGWISMVGIRYRSDMTKVEKCTDLIMRL
jgi:hypothetical protein